MGKFSQCLLFVFGSNYIIHPYMWVAAKLINIFYALFTDFKQTSADCKTFGAHILSVQILLHITQGMLLGEFQ